MPAHHTDHKINKYFFLAIILLFGVFLFSSLVEFFTAFLAAVMFYVLGRPSMEYLVKKKHWGKRWAAVAILFVSLFIILLPIALLAWMLYNEARLFLQDPDIILNTLRTVETSVNAKFNIKIFSESNINEIQSLVTMAVTSILNQGLNLVATISMAYFFLYFMLININRMEAAIVFFLPFKKSKIYLFGAELVSQTFSNAVGVPMIAVVQGVCGLVAYLIGGLPQAGFWAIITGFASIIPVVGTAVVWLPAGTYLIVTGHTQSGIFVMAWGAIILGSADNVVRFLLAKRMADTHPIITVLGVVAGLKYFGLTGLIFGPLLISYFVILLKIYYLEYQNETPPVKRNKNMPVRFNLPFLGNKPSKKPQKNDASDRSNQPGTGTGIHTGKRDPEQE